mgnify:CR=1 FL=1
MSDIGVRELKIHASKIVRRVKESGVRYIVTHRGRPVAAIIPVEEVQAEAKKEGSAWDELVSLGQQISQGWQAEQSSTELLSEMRK